MSQSRDSYTQALSVFCRTAQQAATVDGSPSDGLDREIDSEHIQQLQERANMERAAALEETPFATLLKKQMAAVEDR